MIRFGTSGWRAITSDEFTFNNVRLVTQAIADYIKSQSPITKSQTNPKVIVGYDTRFLSKEFAQASCEVLADNGLEVLQSIRDVPSPAVSYHIVKNRAAGGINITASHNPPEYNGIKFSPSHGGPAETEITSWIERRISQLTKKKKRASGAGARREGKIHQFNPAPGYLKRIKSLLDMHAIRRARLKVVVDCMYGTSRGYLDTLLHEAGAGIEVLNAHIDPMFGGKRPEPNEDSLKELGQAVRAHRANLGLATDPDADRFGIVDSDGRYIGANEIIGLLFDHLVKTRPKRPYAARTVATTHMIDALADRYGISVRETPVGFKFIGEALRKGDCIIGGEESGGLSIAGHISDKDGILACMLVCEAVALNRMSVSGLIRRLESKVGKFYNTSINYAIEENKLKNLAAKLNSVKRPLAGFKIDGISRLDGYKFILKGGDWVMFRRSGTEPLVRVYIESRDAARFNALKKFAARFMKG